MIVCFGVSVPTDDLSKELPSASSITLYLRAETNTGKRKPWEKKLPFQISEHPFRVKTRTSLRDASAHIPMSPYPAPGKSFARRISNKINCSVCSAVRVSAGCPSASRPPS